MSPCSVQSVTIAYEEALAHFEQALKAKEGQEMDQETAAALFVLGYAQSEANEGIQSQQAWDHIERAFDYYVESGDTARAVAVAQQPVVITQWITGRVEVVSRGLELVAPDSLDAARLLSQHGTSLGIERSDRQGSVGLCQKALGDYEVGKIVEGVSSIDKVWKAVVDVSSMPQRGGLGSP